MEEDGDYQDDRTEEHAFMKAKVREQAGKGDPICGMLLALEAEASDLFIADCDEDLDDAS